MLSVSRFLSCLLFLLTWGLSSSLWGQSLDSLKEVAAQASDPATQAVLWQEVAFQYLYLDLDSTPRYAQRSRQVAKPAGLDSLVAESFLIEGFREVQLERYDSALSLYQQAADRHRELENWDRYATVLANLSPVYQRKSDYPQALATSLEALKRLNQLGDSLRVARTEANTIALYVKVRELAKAEQMARKSMRYLRSRLAQVGSAHSYYTAMGGLAESLFFREKFDSALVYERMVLAGFRRLEDPFSVMTSANNLASTFQEINRYDSAYHYAAIAFELALDFEVAGSILHYGAHAAWMLIELGRIEQAGQTLALARPYLDEVKEVEALYQWYRSESLYHEALGDYQEALQWHQQMYDLRDTMLGEDRVAATLQWEVKYETERKERQLAEAGQQLAQRQLYLSLLTALLIIAILMGLMLWLWAQAKRRAAVQAAVIEEQERGLSAVIQATEEERRRIARDLHDGVGQELGSLSLAFAQLRKQTQHPNLVDELDNRLRSTTDQLRGLSHQMMPRALEAAGLAPAMAELVERSFAHSDIEVRFDAFRIPDELSPEVALTTYRVAQELLSNVIRHAQATEVDVQLLGRREALLLIVEDNGRGFLPDQTSAQGIGLANMHTRLRALGGSLSYEPATEGGTRAVVRLPWPS